MVAVAGIVGLLALVGINAILAGIITRFARLWAETRLGTAVTIGLAVPLVLTLSTMVLSGVLFLGFNVQDTTVAVILAIGLPMALGVTIDYVWVASPEEVNATFED